MSFGRSYGSGMKSSNSERSPLGIATLLAILANLIVVVQFVGESVAVAVVAVLAIWGVGLAYGRRILGWIVRYRRDLLFLLLGGLLAAGIGGAVLSRTEASTPCPPPPAPTPCPDGTTKLSPEPTTTPASEIVYRTKSGEKYHRSTCSYVKGKAIPTSLKEAKEMGLTPCKVCHPPPLP
jgi:hypothetical protein